MKSLNKAKTCTIVKKLDWNRMVKDMLDSLFLSQQDLSERCKVSQQSISNWKNRTRNPGIFAKQKLYGIAKKEGMDLSKYETSSTRNAISKYLEKSTGKEIVRIFELYQKMSRSSRVKVLKYANSLVR
jgi:transcriptional regulator with XRE-family HTH domain